MLSFVAMVQTLGELLQFLWIQQHWWLLPLVVMLLLFGGIIILGSTAGVGPFIYTVF